MNSLYSIGFPAVTSFLGFGYALERKIERLQMNAMGIVVHESDFQAIQNKFRPSALKSKKFPSVKARKPRFPNEASADSFQVRSYVNLNVSLIIECGLLGMDAREEVIQEVSNTIPLMRLSGGTITHFELPQFFFCEREEDVFLQNRDSAGRQLVRRIMPGYALLSRTDIMSQLAQEGKGDALDRIIYAISTDATPQASENNSHASYRYERHMKGWLVPLAIGFHDLSGNLKVKSQRSYDYEHHFVEPLVTLCEFRMPHHLTSIEDLMWHYEYDSSAKNYLCVNKQTAETE